MAATNNIGRIIQDSFCNGYADREYDMDGAVIIAEGDGWIVCRKENGLCIFIDFQQWDWVRNAVQQPTGEIENLRIDPNKQSLIDKWCEQDGE